MYNKISTAYRFERQVEDETIGLDVYISYNTKTYDIYQDGVEGISIKSNNEDTKINKAYMLLTLEALDFIENELYNQFDEESDITS